MLQPEFPESVQGCVCVSVYTVIKETISLDHTKDPLMASPRANGCVCLFVCGGVTALAVTLLLYYCCCLFLICFTRFPLFRFSMPTQTHQRWCWTVSLSLSSHASSASGRSRGRMASRCASSSMAARSQVRGDAFITGHILVKLFVLSPITLALRPTLMRKTNFRSNMLPVTIKCWKSLIF